MKLQWKVWVREQAEKEHVHPRTIERRFKRGQYKPRREVIHCRLIFVDV